MKEQKKYNKSTIMRLLAYAKPYTLWFVVALFFIVLVVVLELYQPILIGNVADYIEKSAAFSDVSEFSKKIIITALKYSGIVIIIFVLNYIQTMILSYVGQKIIFKVRMDVFEHLSKLSVNFFNINPIGKLVTRVTNDIETLNEMYTSVIVNMAKSVCILGGIIITMLFYNVKLSLLTFTVIPFIILFTAIFNKISRDNHGKIRTRIARINSFLSEHISGMK
ncbi:MAG: ABC transporter ATP-binding protein, partial [Oscillospiraceae bacterium]